MRNMLLNNIRSSQKIFSQKSNVDTADQSKVNVNGSEQPTDQNGKKDAFCPGYTNPSSYVPYYRNFQVVMPAQWCISFGFGSTWGQINYNKDWYFYSKKKVGLNLSAVAGTYPCQLNNGSTNSNSNCGGVNDLYFCGPVDVGDICGSHYTYYNGIDAPPTYGLPQVDIGLLGYNGLAPRNSYNARVMLREKITNPNDFINWAATYAYGAGYRINQEETNNEALDALRNIAHWDPTRFDDKNLENKHTKPVWQPPGIDPKLAIVFDLDVRCVPPKVKDGLDITTILAQPEDPNNPPYNDDLANEWVKRYNNLLTSNDNQDNTNSQTDSNNQDFQNTTVNGPDTSIHDKTLLKVLLDRYYGGCLGVFGRKGFRYAPLTQFGETQGVVTFWENTGARAYMAWGDGKDPGNKLPSSFPKLSSSPTGVVYEIRTDSPKLERIECGTFSQTTEIVGEQYDQCSERPLLGFRRGNDFMRYFLEGQDLGEFKDQNDVQSFINACINNSNEDVEHDNSIVNSELFKKQEMKNLLTDCRLTNWWEEQEGKVYDLIDSFRLVKVQTPDGKPVPTPAPSHTNPPFDEPTPFPQPTGKIFSPSPGFRF